EVDPITGAPEIEVPLFEINTKVGKIPFKLSYHIGRLKPSELTGPVGWGWTLTPNLGITRSILGLKDDDGGGYPSASNTQFGSSDCLYNLSLARGWFDEQPDDFYYSLLSGSGRFLYRRDGTFSTPGKVKIIRPSRDKFQIIDVDGTIYNFG